MMELQPCPLTNLEIELSVSFVILLSEEQTILNICLQLVTFLNEEVNHLNSGATRYKLSKGFRLAPVHHLERRLLKRRLKRSIVAILRPWKTPNPLTQSIPYEGTKIHSNDLVRRFYLAIALRMKG